MSFVISAIAGLASMAMGGGAPTPPAAPEPKPAPPPAAKTAETLQERKPQKREDSEVKETGVSSLLIRRDLETGDDSGLNI